MGRRNKKKNSHRPTKPAHVTSQSTSTSDIPPPAYTEYPIQPEPGPSTSRAPPPEYQRDPVVSGPPPYTSRQYAIPKNTKPEFIGILNQRLEQSRKLFGGEDGPIDVPTDIEEILNKLCYPAPGENSADYLLFKTELHALWRQNKDKQNKKWLSAAIKNMRYLDDAGNDLEREQRSLYEAFKKSREKEFLLALNQDLQGIYKDVQARNVMAEMGDVMIFFHFLRNKEEIEDACSTKHGLLQYFSDHPEHFLMREKFKTVLLFTDHIGLTVRSHSPMAKELDRYIKRQLPSAINVQEEKRIYIAGTGCVRDLGDYYINIVARSHRIILLNLVNSMPKFLGTALDEYFEFDANAKEWQDVKRIYEAEIAQEGYVPVTNRSRTHVNILETRLKTMTVALETLKYNRDRRPH
ncbi:hypothetical protein B9Z55_002673 [Caenorhabditis nigoni]|uniref:Uncharacterized protein n=1 Tax=Caenorhabditis nigoni TaxID=1611254 RepID=A0A2G5VLM7_9PELO|nr:hypothetical protein B9Z55_002673 [Caenorhabditis nigoni]